MAEQKTFDIPALFKSTLKLPGKYALFFTSPAGKTQMVPVLGYSQKPFEVVCIYPETKWMAVRKYHESRGRVTPRLYLVNCETGQVAPRMEYGTAKIRYLASQKAFYYDSYSNLGRVGNYSWCLVKGTVIQVINVPTGCQELLPTKCAPVVCITPSEDEIAPAPVQKDKVDQAIRDLIIKFVHEYNYGGVSDKTHQQMMVHFKDKYDAQNRRLLCEVNEIISDKRFKPLSELKTDVIRQRFYKQRNINAVTPEVRAEMVLRYGDQFDPATDTFVDKRVKGVQNSKDASVRSKYFNEKRAGGVSDEVNEEMARRYPDSYDPVRRTLCRKGVAGRINEKTGKIDGRRQPLDKMTDDSLIHRYYDELHHGGVTDELNNELARRLGDRYNSKLRIFDNRMGRRRRWRERHERLAEEKMAQELRLEEQHRQLEEERRAREEMYRQIRQQARAERAAQDQAAPQKTEIATAEEKNMNDSAMWTPWEDKDYSKLSTQVLRNYFTRAVRMDCVTDALDAEMQKRFADRYDPETRRWKKQTVKTAPVSETVEILNDTVLEVKKKFIKMTQDGSYYDVFVNGKRILQNHLDTNIQTFLEGTVLGIHGIVTGNPAIPEKPSWQIYDINMKLKKFDKYSQFSSKKVFVERVTESADKKKLTLGVSNHMTVIMEKPSLVSHLFKVAQEHGR